MEAVFTRTLAIVRNPNLVFGGLLALLLAGMTLVGGSLTHHDPFHIDMGNRLQGASSVHWFGTDQLGRDVFSRIIYGTKLTVGLGVFAIIVAIFIGVPIGLVSGFYGGKIDTLFMRIVDGILAFPDFILAIAIAGILGPNLTNVIIAIVLVRWIVYARVVRGLVLAEKEKEYVLASKLSHSSAFKIIRIHLVPHIIPEIIVMAAIDIGKVILFISALSYIGIGAQPPVPEWGSMLNEGRGYFQVAPSMMIYPGLAIMITVLCCNFLGDGLKSFFNSRKGGSRFE